LITLLEELQVLGIAFVSLAEGIDATTPAGKLQMHILGAIAEFERARIAERVKAGLQRANRLRRSIQSSSGAFSSVASEPLTRVRSAPLLEFLLPCSDAGLQILERSRPRNPPQL
jgi:DNA invertase Pin-like site-specific DNA recombinase